MAPVSHALSSSAWRWRQSHMPCPRQPDDGASLTCLVLEPGTLPVHEEFQDNLRKKATYRPPGGIVDDSQCYWWPVLSFLLWPSLRGLILLGCFWNRCSWISLFGTRAFVTGTLRPMMFSPVLWDQESCVASALWTRVCCCLCCKILAVGFRGHEVEFQHRYSNAWRTHRQ
jgi:hypothetical protein